MGQSDDRLVDMAMTIGAKLAENGAVASPAAVVDALIAARIPELLELAARYSARPREMPPKRYSVRANPSIADGAMTTISFRVPKRVREIFDARVAELREANDAGIATQTDAGQDAIVKWCLLEGK